MVYEKKGETQKNEKSGSLNLSRKLSDLLNLANYLKIHLTHLENCWTYQKIGLCS